MVPDSIESRLARLDEQLKAFRVDTEAVRYIAQQLHEQAKQLAVYEERANELRRDLGATEGRLERTVERIEKSCNDLGENIRQVETRLSTRLSETANARIGARATVTVALIAAAATILAGKLP